MSKLVSGPVNVARLKKNNKIVYLMFDDHSYSSSCEGNAPHIDTFIKSECFKNSQLTYDFFLEAVLENKYFDEDYDEDDKYDLIEDYRENYSDSYIHQTAFAFHSGFASSTSSYEQEKLGNIRVHRLDIRQIIIHCLPKRKNIMHFFRESLSRNSPDFGEKINMLVENYQFFRKHVMSFISNNYDIRQKTNVSHIFAQHYHTHHSSLSQEELADILDYVLNKTLIFENKSFQKLMYGYILQQISDFDDIMENVKKNKNDSKKLEDSANNGLQKFRYLLKLLFDLYSVRRLIEKTYITNCIFYAGANHSADIAIMLIKYFGYEMTHIANNDHKKSKITDLINKSEYGEGLIDVISDEFVYLKNEDFLQCVNMEKFPTGFK